MGALASFSSTAHLKTVMTVKGFLSEWGFHSRSAVVCVIHAGWQPRELRHRGPALLRTDRKLHGLEEIFFFRFRERVTAVTAPSHVVLTLTRSEQIRGLSLARSGIC